MSIFYRNCSDPPTHPKFRFSLPILNILCCLLSTKCTATLLKDRFIGEYYKILQETTKPFVKKHLTFIEQERNKKVRMFVEQDWFVCFFDKVYLFEGQDLFVCWIKSTLENFDFRYLPFTHPPIFSIKNRNVKTLIIMNGP